jgi:hypothetical protein
MPTSAITPSPPRTSRARAPWDDHPAQHQPGQRHGQVEEHRRLTAIALIARQAEQIGHASPEGAPWPGDHARHAIDRQRGGRREEHGHHLILHHAQSAQQPDRRIEDEQAHRLAVPDVHIGDRAMQHPVADQQIELLVDVQHGIAESGAANQQGGQQQARHGTQHFPRESAGAGWSCRSKADEIFSMKHRRLSDSCRRPDPWLRRINRMWRRTALWAP